MQAQGEHLLIRKPKKNDSDGTTILMPENHEKVWGYGRVISVGAKVAALIDGEGAKVDVGDFVLYDPMGVRELVLHPREDSEIVVAHASQVFCTIAKEQLESRKLPIPK